MDATSPHAAPVLVVGAGPVGLTMACELLRHGAACRIIDHNDGPTPLHESRALGIQARTMEYFHELGIADEVRARARPLHGLSAFSEGKRVAHLTFDFDDLDTRFPSISCLPQSVTERLLLDRLATLGGTVERRTALTAIRDEGGGVVASVSLDGGPPGEWRTDWLVGCDGSQSVVRRSLGLKFEGGEYEERFLIADARVDWAMPVADDEIAFFLTPEGPIVSFPLPESGRWRLVDTSGKVDAKDQGAILERFRGVITAHVSPGATVEEPSWTSSFHIHRRVVNSYRQGRVFVAGDAAHLHSPAGGQGMNTGIQDAYNLGWKLALVVQGKAGEGLLDSYSTERRPAAAGVLKGTDLTTRVVTLRNPVAKGVRDSLMGLLGEFDLVRRKVTRAISELALGYRDSPIVADDHASMLHALAHPSASPGPRALFDFSAGPRPGDRAPDVPLDDGEPGRWLLDSKHPTRHTLFFFRGDGDEPGEPVEGFVGESHAGLMHTVVVSRQVPADGDHPEDPVLDPSGAAHDRYGARASCLYLVRPDGYIAYRSLPADAAALRAYLDRTFATG